jgi:sulfopropanediol 3-dehydrogenase
MTETFLKRPTPTSTSGAPGHDGLRMTVEHVIADVRQRGDAAVRTYSDKFDRFSPPSFLLTSEEIEAAIARASAQTIADIRQVQQNVRRFAELQLASLADFEAEVEPGVFLGQKNVPIDAVGAYVPGGRPVPGACTASGGSVSARGAMPSRLAGPIRPSRWPRLNPDQLISKALGL